MTTHRQALPQQKQRLIKQKSLKKELIGMEYFLLELSVCMNASTKKKSPHTCSKPPKSAQNSGASRPETHPTRVFQHLSKNLPSVYGMHENPWVKTLSQAKKYTILSLKTISKRFSTKRRTASKYLFDRFSVLSMIDRRRWKCLEETLSASHAKGNKTSKKRRVTLIPPFPSQAQGVEKRAGMP